MPKLDLPPCWTYQAYRFEVDRPARNPAIPSHTGLNEKRSKDHEARIAAGTRKPGEYQAVSEWCPWTAYGTG